MCLDNLGFEKIMVALFQKSFLGKQERKLGEQLGVLFIMQTEMIVA